MDIDQILETNKDLNFVKRIRDPYIYPNIPNKDGSVSTHRMAYSEADGKFYAFPTIVQGEDGKLQQLSMDQADDHAMKTGELIWFDNEKDAKDFSAGAYKKNWKDKQYQESLF